MQERASEESEWMTMVSGGFRNFSLFHFSIYRSIVIDFLFHFSRCYCYCVASRLLAYQKRNQDYEFLYGLGFFISIFDK
jgi:hypothetical protein